MLPSFKKAKTLLGLLPLFVTLGGRPQRTLPHRTLMIRVSQESSPGAGDFDHNILGYISALQTQGDAASFYMYGGTGPAYGNRTPGLTSHTSHLFFVNGVDGLSLFVVHGVSNQAERGSSGGAANTRFELSGGSASILLSDDAGESIATRGGTVFISQDDWASSFTDGMVIGSLPVGFSIIGQFTSPPRNINSWVVISSDGTVFPLHLVVGQRVRLDVPLGVEVRQDR